MTTTKRVLVTGATGKVGLTFIKRLLADPAFDDTVVRALCHNRILPPQERLEIVKGSITEQATVDRVRQDVTHVLHGDQ